MKILSTEGLTKLIELIKSSFISVDNTEVTSEVNLATVATTGDYDDLTNKPTIDSELSTSSTNAVQNKVITNKLVDLVPYIQKYEVENFNTQEVVDAADLLTATGDLHALDLDLSKNTQLKKLTASGTSGNLANVSAALVSNEAPLDSTISPQIDVSYSSLNKAALVNLFNSMPYNVAYTKVGTPIFDGSSVSGFSSSNYLQIQRNNDFYAQNSFEFVIKFKAGTSTTSGTLLGFGCRCKNTGSEAYYGFYTNNNNGGAMYCGFDSSNNMVSHGVSFTAGTDYYLKWSKQNGTLYIHQSSDGVTWTELANDGGADNTTMPSANYLKPIYFFRNSWPDSSVDLNNTYGKINGVSWFGPGVTRNLVPEGTVVGSPTIEDGLLLMPNASNRVMVSSMQLSNKPFEIGSKIKLNSLETVNYSSYGSGSYLLPFYVRSNAIDFLFRQSSSDEWYEARISQTPVVDTWYWWKIIHDGNGLYTFKISTNNSDWTTATMSLNSPLNFPSMTYLIGVSSSNVPPKAIDLKETYIKVNGNMWFSGMIPQVKTCSVVGCTGTADLTQTDKDIALDKGWSLTVA